MTERLQLIAPEPLPPVEREFPALFWDDPLVQFVARQLVGVAQDDPSIIFLNGVPGSGKSTLALTIARINEVLLGREDRWEWPAHVHYEGASYLNAVETLPEFSYVILNEGGEDLFNQEWWKEVSKALVKSFQISRARNIGQIIIIPSEQLANKGIKVQATCKGRTFRRGYTRYCTLWRGSRPVTPVEKYTQPWWDARVSYYRFQALPRDMDAEYKSWDLSAKADLQSRYIEKASDTEKLDKAVESCMKEHPKPTIALLRQYGLTDAESRVASARWRNQQRDN